MRTGLVQVSFTIGRTAGFIAVSGVVVMACSGTVAGLCRGVMPFSADFYLIDFRGGPKETLSSTSRQCIDIPKDSVAES